MAAKSLAMFLSLMMLSCFMIDSICGFVGGIATPNGKKSSIKFPQRKRVSAGFCQRARSLCDEGSGDFLCRRAALMCSPFTMADMSARISNKKDYMD